MPRLACVIVFGATAALAALFASAALTHGIRDLAPYNLGEFLITYQAGFVRRGLLGEFFFRLPFTTSVERVEALVKVFSAGAWLASAYVLGRWILAETRSAATLLLILLQPFLFAFPILTFEWIRKDCFLLLLFYLSLTRTRQIAVVNALSIVAILSHELYGLSFLPLLLIVAVATDVGGPLVTRLVRAVTSFSPALVVMGLVVLNHGDEAMAAAIVEAWRARGVILYDTHAIYALRLSAADATNWLGQSGSGGFWFPPVFWPPVILVSMWALSAAATLRTGAASEEGGTRQRSADAAECLIIVGFCFAMLFIIGSDFGRWVFLWAAASAALVFTERGDRVVHMVRAALPRPCRLLLTLLRRVVFAPAALPVSGGARWTIALLVVAMLFLPVPSYMAEAHPTLVWQRSLALRVWQIVAVRS